MQPPPEYAQDARLDVPLQVGAPIGMMHQPEIRKGFFDTHKGIQSGWHLESIPCNGGKKGMSKIAAWHNIAFTHGFYWILIALRYIFFPFTIIMAFIAGTAILAFTIELVHESNQFFGSHTGIFYAVGHYLAESFGLTPFAAAVGQWFGSIVLAFTGKADYYEKKKKVVFCFLPGVGSTIPSS